MMEFKLVWSGQYAPAAAAVSRLNKRGILAWISVGECDSDVLTPQQLGRAIAIIIFAGVNERMWVAYKRENSESDWKYMKS